jgi:hypothetical protein
LKRDFVETVAFVMEKEVVQIVVCYENVRAAVGVEVGHGAAHSLPHF